MFTSKGGGKRPYKIDVRIRVFSLNGSTAGAIAVSFRILSPSKI